MFVRENEVAVWFTTSRPSISVVFDCFVAAFVLAFNGFVSSVVVVSLFLFTSPSISSTTTDFPITSPLVSTMCPCLMWKPPPMAATGTCSVPAASVFADVAFCVNVSFFASGFFSAVSGSGVFTTAFTTVSSTVSSFSVSRSTNAGTGNRGGGGSDRETRLVSIVFDPDALNPRGDGEASFGSSMEISTNRTRPSFAPARSPT
mmetsp:Transcript_7186/g.24053  ORF Transcript_7186/g.24053 Transcript_7186/m.24053 type:complete len:203 (-) Transcript_7186:112-720(-)